MCKVKVPKLPKIGAPPPKLKQVAPESPEGVTEVDRRGGLAAYRAPNTSPKIGIGGSNGSSTSKLGIGT